MAFASWVFLHISSVFQKARAVWRTWLQRPPDQPPFPPLSFASQPHCWCHHHRPQGQQPLIMNLKVKMFIPFHKSSYRFYMQFWHLDFWGGGRLGTIIKGATTQKKRLDWWYYLNILNIGLPLFFILAPFLLWKEIRGDQNSIGSQLKAYCCAKVAQSNVSKGSENLAERHYMIIWWVYIVQYSIYLLY